MNDGSQENTALWLGKSQPMETISNDGIYGRSLQIPISTGQTYQPNNLQQRALPLTQNVQDQQHNSIPPSMSYPAQHVNSTGYVPGFPTPFSGQTQPFGYRSNPPSVATTCLNLPSENITFRALSSGLVPPSGYHPGNTSNINIATSGQNQLQQSKNLNEGKESGSKKGKDKGEKGEKKRKYEGRN